MDLADRGVLAQQEAIALAQLGDVADQQQAAGDLPATQADATWQANLEYLQAAAAQARRVENVPLPLRFDVRQRDTRRDPWPDAWALLRAGWAARGRTGTRPAS